MTEKLVPPSPVIPPLDARGLMGQPFMLWTQQLTRTVEDLVAGGGGGGVVVHTHTASQVTDFSAAVFAAGAISAPEMYARQVHFFYGDYL